MKSVITILVLGVLVISTAGLKYFRTILTQKTRVGFITWMRSKNMENFLHSDLSYFHQERLGVMTGTLTFTEALMAVGAAVTGGGFLATADGGI